MKFIFDDEIDVNPSDWPIDKNGQCTTDRLNALAYALQKYHKENPIKTPIDLTVYEHKPRLKVYISGPITGKPNGNRSAFFAIGALLSTNGYSPINPHEVLCGVPQPRWTDYMKSDIKVMLDCDAVAMLPGWFWSRGARLEHRLARKLDIPVWYFCLKKNKLLGIKVLTNPV